MKKILLAVIAIVSFAFTSHAQVSPSEQGCCGGDNIVKNAGFEVGGSAGSDLINNATDWASLFGNIIPANSNADYWVNGSNPTTPVDQPTFNFSKNGKKWAGMWLRKNCANPAFAYREGIKGNLIGSIAPNSGVYCISMDLAKDVAHGWTGSSRILVYGYSGTLATITNNTTNCSQTNNQILSGASNLKLLAVFPTNTLTNNFTTFTQQFNTSILSGPINGFIITRGDETTGMQYVFIDNVAFKKYISPCNR